MKGTASTTEEFTFELVWRRADIASGLQFRQKVANQIPGLPQDSIMTALRSYLQEAEKQAEWQRFSELHRNLELDTVETLRQANVTLRDALKPASIDAFEPEYALRRNQFRNERLQIVKSSLEGTAAEYVDAFQAVNDMINLSLGEVLGQLVAYRRPRELGHIDALDFLGDSEVEFVFAGFERVGMILDISDEAIDQAAQLTGVSMSSSDGKETVRMKARLIPGLRAGLRMAEAL